MVVHFVLQTTWTCNTYDCYCDSQLI